MTLSSVKHRKRYFEECLVVSLVWSRSCFVLWRIKPYWNDISDKNMNTGLSKPDIVRRDLLIAFLRRKGKLKALNSSAYNLTGKWLNRIHVPLDISSCDKTAQICFRLKGHKWMGRACGTNHQRSIRSRSPS